MSSVSSKYVKYILSRPMAGAGGKTGTWRVHRPVIDAERCIKCGLCWLYCPENAIDWLENKTVTVDYDYCKGCGICSDVCPVGAVTMVKEGVI
ncbi:MAG: 4Fe-4S binding protein [Caldivirga sp.]|jgi:pyruvate ferredoxin oxidoreductase delta subunit|nr:MAG: ferredoxin [Caldivirga sp. MG_3]KUO89141.1 MAG: ferredoxin [Caldivirga sp. CIS_19]MDT7903527.1 4Fe-4S binding protein [Caldivirga sp.]